MLWMFGNSRVGNAAGASTLPPEQGNKNNRIHPKRNGQEADAKFKEDGVDIRSSLGEGTRVMIRKWQAAMEQILLSGRSRSITGWVLVSWNLMG